MKNQITIITYNDSTYTHIGIGSFISVQITIFSNTHSGNRLILIIFTGVIHNTRVDPYAHFIILAFTFYIISYANYKYFYHHTLFRASFPNSTFHCKIRKKKKINRCEKNYPSFSAISPFLAHWRRNDG